MYHLSSWTGLSGSFFSRHQFISNGLAPPPGKTYDQWIVCNPYFADQPKYQKLINENCRTEQDDAGGCELTWFIASFHLHISYHTPMLFHLECFSVRAPPATQWSPRRHHASVYFQGYLWVMGGRAREFVTLAESHSIGGVHFWFDLIDILL